MLTILSWLVFGLAVGLLARLVLPGRDPMGLLGSTALGVAGAFLGGALASLLDDGRIERLEPGSFIGSLLGATLLLYMSRRMRARA